MLHPRSFPIFWRRWRGEHQPWRKLIREFWSGSWQQTQIAVAFWVFLVFVIWPPNQQTMLFHFDLKTLRSQHRDWHFLWCHVHRNELSRHHSAANYQFFKLSHTPLYSQPCSHSTPSLCSTIPSRSQFGKIVARWSPEVLCWPKADYTKTKMKDFNLLVWYCHCSDFWGGLRQVYRVDLWSCLMKVG